MTPVAKAFVDSMSHMVFACKCKLAACSGPLCAGEAGQTAVA